MQVVSLNQVILESTIWDRVFQPAPMLFIGLVFGALIAGFTVYNIFWLSFYKKVKKMQYINATNGVTNSVMNIVEIGVVAYTDAGTFLFNNTSSLKKLHVDKLPDTFNEFVDQFIQDRDTRVQLELYESLLDKDPPETNDDEDQENPPVEAEKAESVVTRMEIAHRVIQIQFSKPFFPNGAFRGWVIVIEDVTTAARQEQQRRLFVSTVSHELKTPLATIKGYCETLLDWGIREKDPKEVYQDFLKINSETERITTIIGNLTFLSQIENNKDKITMQVYKIDHTVEELCRRYHEEAQAKGIQLYYQSMNRNMPTVFGCITMMEQMVGNLINNAIKYSPNNSKIWVFVQAVENTVTIKVQDQGKGISKQDQEKIFDPFFRVDETGSRKAGGSGLGLAIVKMMAEVQECEVGLVTRTEAEEDKDIRSEIGSDFFITVPTARSVFAETLSAMQNNADREEVLYRKAKQYMERINEDEYDLGEDLRERKDEEYVNLLMDRLVFVDECDIIDEVSTPAMHEMERFSEPMVPNMGPRQGEEPASYVEQERLDEVIASTMAEAVPQVEDIAPAADIVMPQMNVTAPVENEPAPVPEEYQAQSPMQYAGAPLESGDGETAETTVHHEPTILVPDPPSLKHPIFSKEMIGSQNAEKRRKSRAKTIAEKKEKNAKGSGLPSQEEHKAGEPSGMQRQSLLKQLTSEVSSESEGQKSKTSMLFQMTNPNNGDGADGKK